MRVRGDFVALDRAARDAGAADDGALAKLHEDARVLHDRWAAVFRAENIRPAETRAATPAVLT